MRLPCVLRLQHHVQCTVRLRGGMDEAQEECPICMDDDGGVGEAYDLARGLVMFHLCDDCVLRHRASNAVNAGIVAFRDRMARVQWQNAQRLSLAVWHELGQR